MKKSMKIAGVVLVAAMNYYSAFTMTNPGAVVISAMMALISTLIVMWDICVLIIEKRGK